MIKECIQITDENLSIAWAKAFLTSMKPGVTEISPLTIIVTGLIDSNPLEVAEIRYSLDAALADCNLFSVNTTANTIFPSSLWNPQKEAQELYDRYHKVLPSLKKIQPNNRYGLYFERLTSYGETRRNQLKYIVDTYHSGNHRRSALQVAIFDPLRDQTNQRQRGFPCLQQVAFIPSHDTNELSVHGFYATQYLFDRAYGNLIGLARLGHFVAHELGLHLTKISCSAAVAKFSDVSKRQLQTLKDQLESIIVQ
jgi:thymidylate synthase